ncbi:hypothetical protein [Kocuria sp. U4B]
MPPQTPDPRLDDEVRARHADAVAAGEPRMLSRTKDGQLHSYARDEIGIVRAGSGIKVTSAAGMALLAAFFVAVAVFSVVLVAAPTSRGQDPLWGALVLTTGALAAALYAGRLARAEVRARRVRRARGVPEPTSRSLDC